jgi:hypothetical protein
MCSLVNKTSHSLEVASDGAPGGTWKDARVRSRRFGRTGRIFARGFAVLLALAVGAGAPATASALSAVVGGSEVIGGHTYAQWEARAWQWQIANLRFYDSSVPRAPRCTTSGQTGPVWYLGGDNYEAAGDSIKRACDVPSGRYLFIADPSDECSTVEPPPFRATTTAGLESCARSFGPVSSTLTLDGKRLAWPGFVLETPVFSFTMPRRNNYLLVPGATGGRGAAYGEPVMLRPLSAGSHTLVRTESSPHGPTLRSTYELTVG